MQAINAHKKSPAHPCERESAPAISSSSRGVALLSGVSPGGVQTARGYVLTTGIVSQAVARKVKHARRRRLQERDRFNHQTREIALETLRAHFAEWEADEEARRYIMLLQTRACLAFLDNELRQNGAFHG